MSSLRDEFINTHDLYSTGKEMEMVRDDTGALRAQLVMPTAEEITKLRAPMRQAQSPYATGERDPSEIPADIARTLGAVGKGAVSQLAGLPGDVASLAFGLGRVVAADDGDRLNAFTSGVEEFAGKYGTDAVSDFLSSIAPSFLELAPEGDEYAKEMTEQAQLVGEIGGLPGAGRAAAKGITKVAEKIQEAQDSPYSQMGAAGDLDDVLAQGKGVPGGVSHEGRISTRLPTAKVIDEDPVEQPLVIGLEETKRDPKVFEANVDIIRNYPNMTDADAQLPVDEAAESFIEHVKDNLLWVHDRVPEDTRQRSKLWYDGARNIADELSTKYDLPDTSVSGVLAALSPQMDWYKNVDLAKRVMSIHHEKADEVFNDEMLGWVNEQSAKMAAQNKTFSLDRYKPIIDAIAGKKYSELDSTFDKALWLRVYDEVYNDRQYRIISPEGQPLEVAMTDKGEPAKISWGSFVEIGKAIDSIEASGDKSKLTPLMGIKHKVRNFYNNILDPNGIYGDVTIDTHAVAAGLLRPLSGNSTEVYHNFGSSPAKNKRGADWFGAAKNSSKTGVQGTYGIFAEAYRRAAAERGVLPREMQSITWEAARGLFTDKFKTKSNVGAINDMWLKYRKGEATLDETRDAVEQFAGGINEPTWK